MDRRDTGIVGGPARFIDVLPSASARDCFSAWLGARRGDDLPLLKDFAPQKLPAATLPWLLIHRLREDGSLVYGLAGEELIRMFEENPKGKPVLGDIDATERNLRIDIIRQSMASGRPFWYTGTLLFENREHVPIGRLCLPARDGAERVLVLIYFVLQKAPLPRRRLVGTAPTEPAEVAWCEERDLS